MLFLLSCYSSREMTRAAIIEARNSQIQTICMGASVIIAFMWMFIYIFNRRVQWHPKINRNYDKLYLLVDSGSHVHDKIIIYSYVYHMYAKNEFDKWYGLLLLKSNIRLSWIRYILRFIPINLHITKVKQKYANEISNKEFHINGCNVPVKQKKFIHHIHISLGEMFDDKVSNIGGSKLNQKDNYIVIPFLRYSNNDIKLLVIQKYKFNQLCVSRYK